MLKLSSSWDAHRIGTTYAVPYCTTISEIDLVPFYDPQNSGPWIALISFVCQTASRTIYKSFRRNGRLSRMSSKHCILLSKELTDIWPGEVGGVR